jgi:hypothetical protein
MAKGKIKFENPFNGHIKEVPVGFSWTMFFFGFFVPLFRGDLKWFLLTVLLDFCTFGLYQIVFAFMYNDIYRKRLISKGFKEKKS